MQYEQNLGTVGALERIPDHMVSEYWILPITRLLSIYISQNHSLEVPVSSVFGQTWC